MPNDARIDNDNCLDLDILPDLLGYQLRRAQTLIYASFSEALSEHGLTHGQFGLLIVAGANPGSTQTALANVFGSNRSVIVRMIDKLEHAGLLARTQQRGDRRSNAIVLTERGTALVATLRDAVRDHESQVAGHLTKDELRTLMCMLVRLNRTD
jgi:DNA-binding MarR family transcriptional regulator